MPNSGIVITNTFNSESGFVPASQLDTNFAQCVTALNTLQTFGNFFVDSGSANAMAITVPSPLIAAYTAGLPLQVKVAAANTGATTINVSGLGTRNVTYPNASALLSGQLVTGGIISLMYDGTQFQYLGSIAGTGGSGTFTGTLTGFTGTVQSASCSYKIYNSVCTLALPSMLGTSNATTMTMTGLPGPATPTNTVPLSLVFGALVDNGIGQMFCIATIAGSSGVITFVLYNSSLNILPFTASGTKGINTSLVLTYPLV